MTPLKIIAVTLGDPAGIGPEVIIKALASDELKEVKDHARLLLIGNKTILERTAHGLNINCPFPRDYPE